VPCWRSRMLSLSLSLSWGLGERAYRLECRIRGSSCVAETRGVPRKRAKESTFPVQACHDSPFSARGPTLARPEDGYPLRDWGNGFN
jgi:hypothetical protein